MKKGWSNLLLGLLAAAVLSNCSPRDGQGTATEAPVGRRVRLPEDDGPHDSLLEWWYWNGHLRSEDGRWFGFVLVFFELRPLHVTFQITHHAIADIQRNCFRFRIERGRQQEALPRAGIDLSHAGLWVKGGGGRDRLHGQVGEYRLELQLEARKAPVLHHRDGYLEYDFGGHTHYYSRTRLAAYGSLSIDGQSLTVAGDAWFDHQWGDMGAVFEQGWDWFGIQLDDGRELMAFRMRFAGQERLRGGSYSPAVGPPQLLSADEIGIFPEGEWQSPHSGCSYPRRWRLQIRELELLLEPLLEDQEFWSHYPRYWEGVAAVSGSATGRAFIELNDYCR